MRFSREGTVNKPYQLDESHYGKVVGNPDKTIMGWVGMERREGLSSKLEEGEGVSILDQLSSQVGDRTEEANRRVAAQCLTDPSLLEEVARGLKSKDTALVGDCAEVLTKVAEERPELVAPYAEALALLLVHKNTRVRWEATHALALVAGSSPKVIASSLPRLDVMIQNDPSTIARDYAVTAIGNYAGTSVEAAQSAYPILKKALALWEGKQAARALDGLRIVVGIVPNFEAEIRALAQGFFDDRRGVVRKAAKSLMRAIGGR